MQPNKFLSTLGLCRRAGKLTYGYDMVTESLQKTYLIFLAADISVRTRNSVMQLAARENVICKEVQLTMADVCTAIGTKPVGIVGVLDRGFAELLSKECEKMIGGKPL